MQNKALIVVAAQYLVDTRCSINTTEGDILPILLRRLEIRSDQITS